jgi:hypothetical protein
VGTSAVDPADAGPEGRHGFREEVASIMRDETGKSADQNLRSNGASPLGATPQPSAFSLSALPPSPMGLSHGKESSGEVQLFNLNFRSNGASPLGAAEGKAK